MQEDEIREKTAKFDHAEKCLTTLNLELKVRFLASKKCSTEPIISALSKTRFMLCIYIMNSVLYS